MPKTIQVKDSTYSALRSYKVGGLTFDDVIRKLMENQDPDAFQAEYREWQRRLLARLEASDEVERLQ